MGSNRRMTREEFFVRTDPLDATALRAVLWTLYWRGSSAIRERIETELDVLRFGPAARKTAETPVDPESVAFDVKEFVALARSGAFIAGNRAVSPKERTRWRFTFKALVTDLERALRHPEPDAAFQAAADLINLGRDMDGTDYFRSEDPVEAAGFVISDMAGALWSAVFRRRGPDGFAVFAVPQLIRWESPYGWTRSGVGRVAAKETLLAEVLAGLLPTQDAWIEFAAGYLSTLDRIAGDEGKSAGDGGSSGRTGRQAARSIRGSQSRSRRLVGWHVMLVDRLVGGAGEDLLSEVVVHPAIDGVERDFVRAHWEFRRGDVGAAQRSIRACLRKSPRDATFLEFAQKVDAAPH